MQVFKGIWAVWKPYFTYWYFTWLMIAMYIAFTIGAIIGGHVSSIIIGVGGIAAWIYLLILQWGMNAESD